MKNRITYLAAVMLALLFTSCETDPYPITGQSMHVGNMETIPMEWAAYMPIDYTDATEQNYLMAFYIMGGMSIEEFADEGFDDSKAEPVRGGVFLVVTSSYIDSIQPGQYNFISAEIPTSFTVSGSEIMHSTGIASDDSEQIVSGTLEIANDGASYDIQIVGKTTRGKNILLQYSGSIQALYDIINREYVTQSIKYNR